MTATVHYLFPPTAADAAGATANPLLLRLRSLVLERHGVLLQTLLREADDHFFALAEKASAGAERRGHLDLLRRLRLQQSDILRRYQRQLAHGFEPAAPARSGGSADRELRRLIPDPTEELEEKLALKAMVARARDEHRPQLDEIAYALGSLAVCGETATSSGALDPQACCEAFRESIYGVEADVRARLVLYKLYERHVLAGLGGVLEAALRLLPAQHPAPATGIGVDAATLQALQRLLGEIESGWGALAPQDAELATALLTLARSPQCEGAAAVRQRLSLVGRLCQDLLGDPHLPARLRQTLERLRFPLIKIALADDSFFTTAAHPVRRMLAEAAEIGAATRVLGPVGVHEVERRLCRLVEQLDLSAGFLQPALATLTTLPPATVAGFFEQLREQDRLRREALLTRVRRTVAQELQRRTMAQSLPPGARRFLRSGWGPLLAQRLLRHGLSSRRWTDALGRLETLLTALGDRAGGVQAFEKLLNTLAGDLFEAGLREDRMELLLQDLREAYDELRHAAPASAAADDRPSAVEAPLPGDGVIELPAEEEPQAAAAGIPARTPTPQPMMELSLELEAMMPPPANEAAAEPGARERLLSQVMAVGGWFRVYVEAQQQTLWLKLESVYPQQDAVSFIGFDHDRKISLRASRFADDLISGRSEPITASDDVHKAWLALRRMPRGG